MEADDEALKVRERQEVKVKAQRSLQEAEAQSFQLYHPQVDQAIRKRQRHKELVTDEMLDNEMAILAPLQEGRPCRQRRWPTREPGPQEGQPGAIHPGHQPGMDA